MFVADNRIDFFFQTNAQHIVCIRMSPLFCFVVINWRRKKKPFVFCRLPILIVFIWFVRLSSQSSCAVTVNCDLLCIRQSDFCSLWLYDPIRTHIVIDFIHVQWCTCDSSNFADTCIYVTAFNFISITMKSNPNRLTSVSLCSFMRHKFAFGCTPYTV